jgi:hypothetical protein
MIFTKLNKRITIVFQYFFEFRKPYLFQADPFPKAFNTRKCEPIAARKVGWSKYGKLKSVAVCLTIFEMLL